MQQIALSNGGVTLIDDEDFTYVNQWKWKRHTQGYACRTSWANGRWLTVLLHRVINKTPCGLETDHINRNKLDNQRLNLRTVTHAENERNKPMNIRNTSGYRGVSWDKARQKWTAKTKHGGLIRNLGRFTTAEEAYSVYLAYVAGLAQ